MINRSLSFQKGQSIVEYVLITALVSLAAVVIFKAFQKDLAKAYQKVGEALIQGVGSSVKQEGENHE